MTSTPRFLLWWALASVPIPWLHAHAVADLFRSSHDPGAFGCAVVVVLWLVVAIGVAVLQSVALARHRRPVPVWPVAVVAGEILAWVAATSLSRQFFQFTGSFGAVRLPGWWFWAFCGVQALSVALVMSSAQALALWGRRWPRAWPLWFGGRAAWSLLTTAAGLTVSMNAVASDGPGWRAAHLTAEAVGTAWLMDRLVFRPSASSRSPQ